MTLLSKETIYNIKNSLAHQHWNKIGLRHHHGICVPLFSIHTANSCGIGEYEDLIPLIEWCSKVNFNVIQLLPLNDPGLDSSPYNSISAFALNPLFLSLHVLPYVSLMPNYKDMIQNIKKETNYGSSVKYKSVRFLKMEFFKKYFSSVGYELTKNNAAYEHFKTENEYWLIPYTIFKTIKDNFNFSTWNKWPKEYLYPDIKSLKQEFHEYINYYSFLQFICFQQLINVKKIANANNIFLKGDIPILISKDSSDTWMHKNLFKLSSSAGAPPDLYNSVGQNWNLPLYEWDNMKNSSYMWWKKRLLYAENFYDIYRLDHIAGFYRIWSINDDRSQSCFVPKKEIEQKSQGHEILSTLLSTSLMLPIGEDLGIIPDWLRSDMLKLGICGTKIIRWERDWNNSGNFIDTSSYNPLSLTTTSTHDSDTMHGWWKHSPKEAKMYCDYRNLNYTPFLTHDNHKSILLTSHHSSSAFHINMLNEYLALVPELVNEDPSEERINTPGTISNRNWSHRYLPNIESLIYNKQLSSEIKDLKLN